MRIHTGEKPYGCYYCDRKFIQSNDRKKHMKMHLNEKNFKQQKPLPVNHSKSNNDNGGEKNYKQHKSVHNNHLDSHVDNNDDDELPSFIVKNNTLKVHKEQKLVLPSTRATYLCHICQQDFSSESILLNHMKSHSDRKEYKCDLCDKYFTHSSNLRRHLRIHSSNQSFDCLDCDKQFIRSSDLKIHSKVHVVERKIENGKMTDNEEDLNSSIEDGDTLVSTDDVNDLSADDHVCHICLKQYSSSGNLTRHMKSHSGVKPYKCKLCNKEFGHKNDYKRHLQKHAINKNSSDNTHHMKLKQKKSEVVDKDNNDDSAVESTNNKTHVCTVCSKQFNFKSNFLAHMRMHSADKPFVCKICGTQFSRNNSWMQHLRLAHSINDPSEYERKYDGVAEDSNILKENKFQNLNGDMNELDAYKCNICTKTYSTLGNLTRHKKAHAGDKSYVSQFVRNRNSKSGSNQDENSVEDSESSQRKTFPNSIDAAIDRIKNNGLDIKSKELEAKCKVCMKSFVSAIELGDHMKNHHQPKFEQKFYNSSPERKHICKLCRKQFSTSGNLTRHMKIHAGSGERLYKCTKCNQQFTKVNDLKEHVEKHCEKLNGSNTQSTNETVIPENQSSTMTINGIIVVESSHACHICLEHFQTLVELNEHLPAHGLEPQDLTQFDIQSILESDLLVIGDSHLKDNQEHICHICSKQFSTRNNLTAHMKIHVGIKSFSNKNRSEKFNQDNYLMRRSPCNLFDKSPEDDASSTKTFNDTISYFENEYWKSKEEIVVVNTSEVCNICFEHFDDKVKLEEHINSVHNKVPGTKKGDEGSPTKVKLEQTPITENQKVNTNNEAEKKALPNGNHASTKVGNSSSFYVKKGNICSICHKKFSTRCNVIRHMKIHAGIKPYKCKECGRKFTQGNDLKRHMKRHLQQQQLQQGNHSDGRRVVSEVASPITPLKENESLNGSINEVNHKDDAEDIVVVNRSHVCYICSEHLLTELDLEEHLNAHEKESNADNSFVNNTGISTPSKDDPSIHDNKTPESKRFSSQYSPYTNSDSPAKKHTNGGGGGPKQCKYCNKEFLNAFFLERHMVIHASESTPNDSNNERSIPPRQLHTPTQFSNDDSADELVIDSHPCHICPAHFPSEIKLALHIQEHLEMDDSDNKKEENDLVFKNKQPYTSIANSKTENSMVKQESSPYFIGRVYGQGKYRCEMCFKTFSTSGNLSRHKKIHYGVKPHKCNVCGKEFFQSSDLKKHMKRHLSESNQNSNPSTPDGQSTSDISHRNSYSVYDRLDSREATDNHEILDNQDDIVVVNASHICAICCEHFPTEMDLEHHAKVHMVKPVIDAIQSPITENNVSINSSGVSILENSISSSPQIYASDGVNRFECSTCQKTFSTDGNLRRHKKSHLGLKPFKCSYCVKQYMHNSDLKRHVRQQHVHLEPDNQVLAKKTKSKNGTHTPSTPKGLPSQLADITPGTHECYICNKQFSSDGNLKRHMRNHTEPVVTPIMKNDTNNELNKVHKNITNIVPPLPQEISPSKHEQPSPLNNGATEHGCHICSKQYSTASNLVRHMKSHVGEKPYKCSKCNVFFNLSNDLKKHKVQCLADDGT